MEIQNLIKLYDIALLYGYKPIDRVSIVLNCRNNKTYFLSIKDNLIICDLAAERSIGWDYNTKYVSVYDLVFEHQGDWTNSFAYALLKAMVELNEYKFTTNDHYRDCSVFNYCFVNLRLNRPNEKGGLVWLFNFLKPLL